MMMIGFVLYHDTGRSETAVAAAVSLHNLGFTTGDCSWRSREEADGGGWERETNRKKRDISRG